MTAWAYRNLLLALRGYLTWKRAPGSTVGHLKRDLERSAAQSWSGKFPDARDRARSWGRRCPFLRAAVPLWAEAFGAALHPTSSRCASRRIGARLPRLLPACGAAFPSWPAAT